MAIRESRSSSDQMLLSAAGNELESQQFASASGVTRPEAAVSAAGVSRPEALRQCGDSGRFSAASLLMLPVERNSMPQNESLFLETDFGVAEKVTVATRC